MGRQEFSYYLSLDTRVKLLKEIVVISHKLISEIDKNWSTMITLNILDKNKTLKNIKELDKNEKEKLGNILDMNYNNFISLNKIEECILSHTFFDEEFDRNYKTLYKSTVRSVKDTAYLTKRSLDKFLCNGKNILFTNAKSARSAWITENKISISNKNVYMLISNELKKQMIKEIMTWLEKKHDLAKPLNKQIAKLDYTCYSYFIENLPNSADLLRKYKEKMKNYSIFIDSLCH